MMNAKEPELINALQQFDELIMETPDERKFVLTFKEFIITLLKTKTTTVTIPIVEVMTVIKTKKPLVFSILKKEYDNNIIMNVVTQIDVEYREAYRKLNDIKRQLGIIKRY
ncbi:hypothetical protein [Halalkalibacter alkaliphilus]|uniref:Uncharacterized protein n=1 Tax=Halalkalibacter alkaliphilus TaxID=2917993 RepID=A0A9X2I566_9BACI|nr:hypothetical protein [Halalkalibacter alkaliphilus]MCL7748446.1 hypothetical protein [Halalkalibacter alkaliphilus]